MKIEALRAQRPILTNRAFTLVEMLLVLVILAALAAVVVPKFTGRSKQAKVAAAQTEISSLEVALDSFEVDNGFYPRSGDDGLEALVVQPNDTPDWKGPYLKRGIPTDPWGNEYLYESPGRYNQHGYDLSSMGPDGREGGDDDIVNWNAAR